MVEPHFCLRWNNYRTNITAEFETLREGEHFVDVTLACEGHQLKAHKVVLSACSPYFKELLQGNPCTHPIIILRDVTYTHMRSLLEFMYAGEVNISQAQLGSFLHTAEALKIRGLAESSEKKTENISPLTALRSTLDTFGGISSALQQPSITEQRPNPFLVHCSEKKSSHLPNLNSPSNIEPIFGSLPVISLPEDDKRATNDGESLGCSDGQPVSPTTGNINPVVGEQNVIIKSERELIEERSTHSPILLPPNKRHCPAQKYGIKSLKDSVLDRISDSSHNGYSHTSQGNCSASSNITSVSEHASSVYTSKVETIDENLPTVPKTEPCDPPLSDAEGSGGTWLDEGDCGSGDVGGNSSSSFNIPPHHSPPCSSASNKKKAPIHSSLGSSSTDSDNTSHLMHTLGSESHLHGVSQSEREFCDDSSLRQQGDNREIRSPPLPPSSLPHSCQLCGKMISCRRNLWKHMERVHFTNPAVRCSLCAKMFKNKYALKDHQRIYHGGLSQLPRSTSHPPQSASLLSRILQDSRHSSHPTEPHSSQDVILSHLSSPPFGVPPTHSHYYTSQRQTEEGDNSGPPSQEGSGSQVEVSQALPHSFVPNVSEGSFVPPPRGRLSCNEWEVQEKNYPVPDPSLLPELHRMVTKAD